MVMTPHPLSPSIPLLPATGRRRSLVSKSSEKPRRANEMRDLLPSLQTRQGSGMQPPPKTVAIITRLLTPIMIQATMTMCL